MYSDAATAHSLCSEVQLLRFRLEGKHVCVDATVTDLDPAISVERAVQVSVSRVPSTKPQVISVFTNGQREADIRRVK